MLIHFYTDANFTCYDIFGNHEKNLILKVTKSEIILPTQLNCTLHTCINIHRCRKNGQHLTIYVYPSIKLLTEDGILNNLKYSQEFIQIIKFIINSSWYTENPNDACLFLPTIDVLNEAKAPPLIGDILSSLPYWNKGENHLLINFIPKQHNQLSIHSGLSLLASGSFSTDIYRFGFDISLPIYNPLLNSVIIKENSLEKPWLIISSQLNIIPKYYKILQTLSRKYDDELLLLHACSNNDYFHRCRDTQIFNYPEILQKGKFCLILKGKHLGQIAFHDVLRIGCIPVVLADGYVFPFEDAIDWNQAVIKIKEHELPKLIEQLQKISYAKQKEMHSYIRWLFENYFSSINTIIHTMLKIIEQRIFPEKYHNLIEWNTLPQYNAHYLPLFLPVMPPQGKGFTAVILAYNRVESLFKVLCAIASAPSLVRILVIWNNPYKTAPHASLWPRLDKSIKVIQMNKNSLSNRFYPYDEIETEAILSLDDDISIFNIDELEFAYEIWREFPDRIVGFPPRIHILNNSNWYYNSKWVNELSMILTGAAFYHKFWNYAYTNIMPSTIRNWIDKEHNCEDIAMNFLIANMTRKAPIKVTPRKKFKCPLCNNQDLNVEEDHMQTRSKCIQKLVKEFGYLPLHLALFRADPVLYGYNISKSLQQFHNIGKL